MAALSSFASGDSGSHRTDLAADSFSLAILSPAAEASFAMESSLSWKVLYAEVSNKVLNSSSFSLVGESRNSLNFPWASITILEN